MGDKEKNQVFQTSGLPPVGMVIFHYRFEVDYLPSGTREGRGSLFGFVCGDRSLPAPWGLPGYSPQGLCPTSPLYPTPAYLIPLLQPSKEEQDA